MDLSGTIPVFLTSEVLYKALLNPNEAQHKAIQLYNDPESLPISAMYNLLGRPIIPLYRHWNYNLKKWPHYCEQVRCLFEFRNLNNKKIYFNKGIALSPTIHRTFDRVMLAISDDYTILIHKNVRDHSPVNGLLGYQNRLIFLPQEEKFYPSLSRLQEHRCRFSF